MNISIVIFCYNEAANIKKVIEEAYHFSISVGHIFEIIVVNDGSTDDTMAVLQKCNTEIPGLRIINHPKNLGIGQALFSGYDAATMEYVCAIPGDAQFDINELRGVQPFGNDIYYSFYRPDTNYSLYRKALTRLNRLFNQHVLGVFLRDVNWIKVYRKEQITMAAPQLRSSLIESEICSKFYKAGIMPVELPSKYLKRINGTAKGGSWKTIKLVFAEVLQLWWVVFTYKVVKPK